MESIGGLIIVLSFFLAIYFLPTIVASNRSHASTGAIFVLNLLLGWTLLGWVAALVWSFANPVRVVVNDQAQRSAAFEIQRLADLKERGLLTEDEFTRKKEELLR